MNRISRTAFKYSVSAILTAGFLYLAFQKTDLNAVLLAAQDANYIWIVVNLACLLVSHWVRAIRWQYLLTPLKGAISFRNLFSVVMIGYAVNNFLPRAGELVRAYVLGRKEGIPKSGVFGTIVIERILDTLTFLALLGIVPFIYDGPLRESFPWLADASIVTAAVTVSGMLVIFFLVFRRDIAAAVIASVKNIFPPKIGARWERVSHSFLDGFLFLQSKTTLIPIMVTSVLVWSLYVLMVYSAFFAFELGVDLGLGAAVVVLAISSIGFAVPTPGGTGAYHFFTSQALVKLFGVGGSVALTYAAVTHAVGFVSTSLFGLYYLLRDHVRISEAVSPSDGKQ